MCGHYFNFMRHTERFEHEGGEQAGAVLARGAVEHRGQRGGPRQLVDGSRKAGGAHGEHVAIRPHQELVVSAIDVGIVVPRTVDDRMVDQLDSVVGATQPQALERLAQIVGDKPFPLLIPGVGSQGGEASAVMARLPGQAALHRVNVSSSILYAFEKRPGLSPAEAAVEAFRAYATALRLP